MTTFLMLGNYSTEAIGQISAGRTKKVKDLVARHGGKIVSMHALLGGFDLAFLVELPEAGSAIAVSVALARETGISFQSYQAIEVSEFDKLVGGTARRPAKKKRRK